MTEKWLFQVRLYFSSDFTKTFNSDKNSNEKEKLITVLNKHNAELLSQFDGFMGYVLEAEKNGIDKYPLYQWTKDSLARKDKIEKYQNSYTVYINSEEVAFNGKIEGSRLNSGTYYYILDLENNDQVFRGSLTIVR